MPNKKSRTPASSSENRLEGEGSYSATRSYNQNLGRALKDKSSIERGAAKASAAVDGPEGPALRAAEKRGKAGPKATAKPPRRKSSERAAAR